MLLRSETQDALHLLLFLGHENPENAADVFVTREQIANAIEIDLDALERIVTQLYHAGYVLQCSDENTALRLSCLPAEVRVGEIVRLFEGPVRLTRDSRDELEAKPLPLRRLGEVFQWASRELAGFLNQYTLDQFLPKKHALATRRRPPQRKHLRLVRF